jgi:hypothetical protein
MASCLFLCVGILLGPVDSLPRALAVGACAGSAASALASFRYPGWPWFCAGLGCAWSGLLRQHFWLDDWLLQWLWSVATMLAFVLVWPLSQATLVHVFHVETQDYDPPFADWEPSRTPALLRGLATSLLSALATSLLLVGLGSSCQWMAGPSWLFLAVWLSHAFPGLRPEWQLLGTLLGLAATAGLGAHPGLKEMVQPCLLFQDSFWLCGQAASWTALGYWCSLWHQQQLLHWDREDA